MPCPAWGGGNGARTRSQIQSFVNGLFALNQDLPAFKGALRDFLIQLKVRSVAATERATAPHARTARRRGANGGRGGGTLRGTYAGRAPSQEFAGDDNRALFIEETESEAARKQEQTLANAMAVPGMIRPQDRPDYMAD